VSNFNLRLIDKYRNVIRIVPLLVPYSTMKCAHVYFLKT